MRSDLHSYRAYDSPLPTGTTSLRLPTRLETNRRASRAVAIPCYGAAPLWAWTRIVEGRPRHAA